MRNEEPKKLQGTFSAVASRKSQVARKESHWSLVIGDWEAGLQPCIAGMNSRLHKKRGVAMQRTPKSSIFHLPFSILHSNSQGVR